MCPDSWRPLSHSTLSPSVSISHPKLELYTFSLWYKTIIRPFWDTWCLNLDTKLHIVCVRGCNRVYTVPRFPLVPSHSVFSFHHLWKQQRLLLLEDPPFLFAFPPSLVNSHLPDWPYISVSPFFPRPPAAAHFLTTFFLKSTSRLHLALTTFLFTANQGCGVVWWLLNLVYLCSVTMPSGNTQDLYHQDEAA